MVVYTIIKLTIILKEVVNITIMHAYVFLNREIAKLYLSLYNIFIVYIPSGECSVTDV